MKKIYILVIISVSGDRGIIVRNINGDMLAVTNVFEMPIVQAKLLQNSFVC